MAKKRIPQMVMYAVAIVAGVIVGLLLSVAFDQATELVSAFGR